MLHLRVPLTYQEERKYICNVLLCEFLGLEYQLEFENRHNVCISGYNGKELFISDIFFQTPPEFWMKKESLPKQPLASWDLSQTNLDISLVNSNLPIIYGDMTSDPSIYNPLPIDIFGSCFFMLTRYEEIVISDRDEFGRFPAKASITYQENFLDRPIVNEYVDILWQTLKVICNCFKHRHRSFNIRPSHDVDKPYKFFQPNTKELFISFTKKLSFKKSILFIKQILNHLKLSNQSTANDPYNTFNWIMDTNERYGLESTFFFFGQNTDHDIDGHYDIKDKNILHLLKKVSIRGHRIGYHGSFKAYTDQNLLQMEFERLKKICTINGIKQEIWGFRQHYLRYHIQKTSLILDEIGINYDSTLTFAEKAGFRCGCCYEYPMFDLLTKRPLQLRELPLLVMESSVLDPVYMGMDFSDAYDYIMGIKRQCQLFDGNFVILWHNNLVVDKIQKEFYESILSS